MIDIVLLVGRVLLIVLLYLFLFMTMKTGIGLVKGQRKREENWSVSVARGPKELRGLKININGPVIIGRSPGADIVIGMNYVSGRHARLNPVGKDLILEDLGSMNGTELNNQVIAEPISLRDGDVITIGNVDIKVRHA